MKLTPKQTKFATLFVECGNASQAYRESYNASNMKPNTINRKAFELLQKDYITATIKELQSELKEKDLLSKEDILNDLAAIASVNIADYVDEFDIAKQILKFKPVSEWTPEMKRACASLKNGKNGIELTLHGITHAYDRICKMLGFNQAEKIDVSVTTSLADLLKKD
ncbi:terminase small subunit [Labilibaculum manganireducens]|uniref:terminase small subunit n=1 Tax=Labilibaculum manganireducens TaxID=1940525 RepID=UPI0029F5616E|nr:terminase small subunit [Labilibaculum manganireducens]